MITLNNRKLATRNLISSINEHEILKDISENCYKRNDSSASWVGPFVPMTYYEYIRMEIKNDRKTVKNI